MKLTQSKNRNNSAFTLVEIVVATVIFAVVVSSLMSLFNYVLKINRRSEALRQAAQGMRGFVDALVKDIHNGAVDYGLNDTHDAPSTSLDPCVAGTLHADYYGSASNNYKDNKIRLVNNEGVRECLYMGDAAGNYIGSGVFTSGTGTLVIKKEGGNAEILNPKNYKVLGVAFFVRPTCDPYTLNPTPGTSPSGCASYGNDYPRIQPFVQISIKFNVSLSSGDQKTIYFQTTVNTNQYDIPS